MDIRLRTREVEGMTIVEVGGELDLHNAPQLRSELARLCDGEKPRVLADLTGLTFIDSTGIGVLVGAHKRALENGGRILFVCPLPRIRRVFEIAGLVRALPLYTTREEALSENSETPITAPSVVVEAPAKSGDGAPPARDFNVPATS